jgi:hypothetical protein
MNNAKPEAETTAPDLGFLRSAKRHILTYSITALSSVALVAVFVTAYMQYRFYFEHTLTDLRNTATGRARLIEAVGRFDALTSRDYPGGPEKATLSQVLSAHERFSSFGKTGEFTLARREGDQIHFLLSRRHEQDVLRDTVAWNAEEAEPMRRALQGEVGHLVGLDYRGVRVLAAHAPVNQFGWGVVAKIDLSEVRSSSIRAGFIAIGPSLLVIAIGIAILIRATSPIIQRFEKRTRELHLQVLKRTQAEQDLAEARSILLTSIEEKRRKFILLEGKQASWFHAVAFDYDGTLTNSGRPGSELLNKLQELRSKGLKLLLVTGRIMAELRRDFMDVGQWFDLIVAENGAVIWQNQTSRTLAAALPVEIDIALRRRRVPFRRGQVLIACDGYYADIVLEELAKLQLDAQIFRNRGELMILPAGISKGTGLAEAQDILGISLHNTIAVGDAENDLSLLQYCELAVAVANAVPTLKAQADVVLDEEAGKGVMELLRHPLLRGEERVESKRWRVRLGHTPEGTAVTLTAAQINVLIAGGSGAGKSFAAGLIAEQLIELGYSICVFDPEGDHVNLAQLRGVSLVGGGKQLTAPELVFDTLQRPLGSTVIDLSNLPFSEKQSYVSKALLALKAQRDLTGTPHWILVDEAHVPFSDHTVAQLLTAGEKGFLLVTYKPRAIQVDTRTTIDFVLAVPSLGQAMEVAEMVSSFSGFPVKELEHFLTRGARQGQSLLIRVASMETTALTLAPRALRHIRHWHKYASNPLPPNQHFVFRSEEGLTGAHAGNIQEFHQELRNLETNSLLHHLRCHDFSRWIKGAMQDVEFGETLLTIESGLSKDSARDLEHVRQEILTLIHRRYLE